MGSVNVMVDDGAEQRDFLLNRPYQGLHVPPHVLVRPDGLLGRAPSCVVLASLPYEEADYIRDHDEFLAFRRSAASA